MKKVFFISKNDMIPQCVEVQDGVDVIEVYDKKVKLKLKDVELNESVYLPGCLVGDLFVNGDLSLPVAMVLYKIVETNSDAEDTIQLEVIKEDLINANLKIQKTALQFFNKVYGAITYGDDGILVN